MVRHEAGSEPERHGSCPNRFDASGQPTCLRENQDPFALRIFSHFPFAIGPGPGLGQGEDFLDSTVEITGFGLICANRLSQATARCLPS